MIQINDILHNIDGKSSRGLIEKCAILHSEKSMNFLKICQNKSVSNYRPFCLTYPLIQNWKSLTMKIVHVQWMSERCFEYWLGLRICLAFVRLPPAPAILFGEEGHCGLVALISSSKAFCLTFFVSRTFQVRSVLIPRFLTQRIPGYLTKYDCFSKSIQDSFHEIYASL